MGWNLSHEVLLSGLLRFVRGSSVYSLVYSDSTPPAIPPGYTDSGGNSIAPDGSFYLSYDGTSGSVWCQQGGTPVLIASAESALSTRQGKGLPGDFTAGVATFGFSAMPDLNYEVFLQAHGTVGFTPFVTSTTLTSIQVNLGSIDTMGLTRLSWRVVAN